MIPALWYPCMCLLVLYDNQRAAENLFAMLFLLAFFSSLSLAVASRK